MHELLESFPELPLLVVTLVAALLWSAVRRVLVGIGLVVLLMIAAGMVLHGWPEPLATCWTPAT